MKINQLLAQERTFVLPAQTDKAALMQHIAKLASTAVCALDETDIHHALVARERLGSTGIGEGVAIPHCRISHCDAPLGLLIKLERPVDFDSLDGHPVDLVFTLITPASDSNAHLSALSHLATLFNQATFRDSLRTAQTSQELFECATHSAFETTISH